MVEMLGGDVLFAEAAKQGLWAVLYISLFVYTLKESRRQEEIARQREDKLREEYQELRKESRERENMLTNFINDISRQYERLATGVERLTVDVDEIKDELKLRRQKREKRGED